MADGEAKRSLVGAVDTFAKILTPIVIFAVGTYYTWTKDAAEREQSALDRCYGYAKDLAKAGVAEQKMLLGFIELQCTDREELRAATLPQVVETATQSKDADIRNSAKETAHVVAASGNSNVANKVEAALTTVSRNIYMHVPEDDRRAEAERIKEQLNEALAKDATPFAIPAIEVVGNDKSPTSTQVRYFRTEDTAEAERIAALLVKFGVSGARAVRSSGNARPFQLEIWLARTTPAPTRNPQSEVVTPTIRNPRSAVVTPPANR